MGAFLGRLFDRDDDKIAIGRGGNDMGSGIRPFLPAIGLFDQFSFLVVNMHRNLCPAHFCTQPKPIFVAFEQLLAHCLLLARGEVPAPIIFPHLKPFPDVRLSRLQREGLASSTEAIAVAPRISGMTTRMNMTWRCGFITDASRSRRRGAS